MKNATVEPSPRSSNKALDRARQMIERELATICELVEADDERPGGSSSWNVVGSMNQIVAELRRVRVSLEESR